MKLFFSVALALLLFQSLVGMGKEQERLLVPRTIDLHDQAKSIALKEFRNLSSDKLEDICNKIIRIYTSPDLNNALKINERTEKIINWGRKEFIIGLTCFIFTLSSTFLLWKYQFSKKVTYGLGTVGLLTGLKTVHSTYCNCKAIMTRKQRVQERNNYINNILNTAK